MTTKRKFLVFCISDKIRNYLATAEFYDPLTIVGSSNSMDGIDMLVNKYRIKVDCVILSDSFFIEMKEGLESLALQYNLPKLYIVRDLNSKLSLNRFTSNNLSIQVLNVRDCGNLEEFLPTIGEDFKEDFFAYKDSKNLIKSGKRSEEVEDKKSLEEMLTSIFDASKTGISPDFNLHSLKSGIMEDSTLGKEDKSFYMSVLDLATLSTDLKNSSLDKVKEVLKAKKEELITKLELPAVLDEESLTGVLDSRLLSQLKRTYHNRKVELEGIFTSVYQTIEKHNKEVNNVVTKMESIKGDLLESTKYDTPEGKRLVSLIAIKSSPIMNDILSETSKINKAWRQSFQMIQLGTFQTLKSAENLQGFLEKSLNRVAKTAKIKINPSSVGFSIYPVLSTQEGNGKTITALGLSDSLMISGSNTIVIDLDWDTPSLYNYRNKEEFIDVVDFLKCKTSEVSNLFSEGKNRLLVTNERSERLKTSDITKLIRLVSSVSALGVYILPDKIRDYSEILSPIIKAAVIGTIVYVYSRNTLGEYLDLRSHTSEWFTRTNLVVNKFGPSRFTTELENILAIREGTDVLYKIPFQQKVIDVELTEASAEASPLLSFLKVEGEGN